MKKSTTIQPEVQEQALSVPQDGTVEFLIAKALDKDTPVEVYEKFLAMRREVKAEHAKEAFDASMAKFQGDCPTIKKTKAGGQTKTGKVAYYYAPLETIVEQVKDIIKENGFSYLIKTQVIQNGVTKIIATCIVKHTLGHSEESAMEVPLGDRTGVMSAPQVTASATTFAKRYAFCNAFGIMTGDDDNDAQTIATEEPTYHPDPQTPPTPQKKHYCSRHFSQLKEKVEITEKVAGYSKATYGFELCLDCQQAAKQAKTSSAKPQQATAHTVDEVVKAFPDAQDVTDDLAEIGKRVTENEMQTNTEDLSGVDAEAIDSYEKAKKSETPEPTKEEKLKAGIEKFKNIGKQGTVPADVH